MLRFICIVIELQSVQHRNFIHMNPLAYQLSNQYGFQTPRIKMRTICSIQHRLVKAKMF